MATRINGSATAMQNLTGDMQYYVCYASSPGAFTNPAANPPAAESAARMVNIQVTGNPLDQSQKNFEVLLMTIGLRAMPVVLNNPAPTLELSDYTNDLSGQGFIWKFAVERGAQFHNYTPYGTPGPVGLLIDDLDGLILPNGIRLTTVSGSASGWARNVSFSRLESI